MMTVWIDLETILGEAIDDEVLPIIEGRPLEQTIEPDDTFHSHLCREMFLVERVLSPCVFSFLASSAFSTAIGPSTP